MEHSNKWRNSLKVKHLFTSDTETTSEKTIEICDCIIFQLERISKREESSNLTDNEKENVTMKIEELVDNFKFLKELADRTILESEWSDYDFDGNFYEWLDDNLSMLYELGDEKVVTKNNIIEKFIWFN